MDAQTRARDASDIMTSRRHWQAFGLIAVLIFAWGGNYTWLKLALRDIGPWTFNAARFCAATLVIGLMLSWRDGWRRLAPAPGERAQLAVVGLLQGAVLTIMITLSLVWIESTRTILLIYTNAVWILLFSLLLGERLTATSLAGVALGIAGIALLANPLSMRWDAATLPGVASALIGTMAWALGSVLYRRVAWKTAFWQQVFWQLAVSAVVIMVAAGIVEGHRELQPTPRLALVLAYNVLIPTALAYWCWLQALARIKASTASQILLLSPVYGVAQSHLVLGEPLSPTVLASAACVVCGAALTFWRGRSQGGAVSAKRVTHHLGLGDDEVGG